MNMVLDFYNWLLKKVGSAEVTDELPAQSDVENEAEVSQPPRDERKWRRSYKSFS